MKEEFYRKMERREEYMTECEWCYHEVEEVEFIENYTFNGLVCEECRIHDIKS